MSLKQIRKRLEKRREPTVGTCQSCGHKQELPAVALPMASSMAVDSGKCAKCGATMMFTFTIGGNGPTPDDDIQTLLDMLESAAPAPPAIRALIEQWRAMVKAAHADGPISASDADAHAGRWTAIEICADELEQALASHQTEKGTMKT